MGDAQEFCLSAGIPTIHMTVAEKTGGHMPDLFLLHVGAFGISAIAQGMESILAIPALATGDHERGHDTITDREFRYGTAFFDHDPHRFVAHDIAGFHGGHHSIHQMQITATDGACRYLDDDVVCFKDRRIFHVVEADIAFTVIAQCAHWISLDFLERGKCTALDH